MCREVWRTHQTGVSRRWEKHEDESAKEQTKKNDAEERAAEHGWPKVKEDGKMDNAGRAGSEVMGGGLFHLKCQAIKPSKKHLKFGSQRLYSATCKLRHLYGGMDSDPTVSFTETRGMSGVLYLS